jgi:hypothetical protein
MADRHRHAGRRRGVLMVRTQMWRVDGGASVYRLSARRKAEFAAGRHCFAGTDDWTNHARMTDVRFDSYPNEWTNGLYRKPGHSDLGGWRKAQSAPEQGLSLADTFLWTFS